MAVLDAGILPVREGDRLVGMITDRDIAIRAVTAGRGPETFVREVMSPEVKYCFEDDDLDHVTRNMADLRVRRLPVLNMDKRLVGIISLGDVAVMQDAHYAETALSGISVVEALGRPARVHGFQLNTNCTRFLALAHLPARVG